MLARTCSHAVTSTTPLWTQAVKSETSSTLCTSAHVTCLTRRALSTDSVLALSITLPILLLFSILALGYLLWRRKQRSKKFVTNAVEDVRLHAVRPRPQPPPIIRLKRPDELEDFYGVENGGSDQRQCNGHAKVVDADLVRLWVGDDVRWVDV